MNQKSYRQKPNGDCYICRNPTSFEKWKKFGGFSEEETEDIWTRLGAKICFPELNYENILPLNDPPDIEGDSQILFNLGERIKNVLRFEKANRGVGSIQSQFPKNVFD